MTSEGNGQPELYKVIVSSQIGQEIKRLHQEAAAQGRGQQFLSSLRAIHDRLVNDPLNFGEPAYRLPLLKLMLYYVVVGLVAVDYAVQQEKRLVFLKGVKMLD
jgi:hypothetical protein